MNKVLSGLFVGNYRDSKDASQLERHKISHIVAIHDAARRVHLDKEYLCIMASDSPHQNLSQYFSACNDFIHCARVQGGNVLIHCLAGMSRSVTIVVAYIMSITPFQLHDATKVVRGARPVSNPNSGFQKQLQEFETLRLFEERRRLLEKFPGTTFLESDEEQCQRLLVSYNNLLLSRAICEGQCGSRVCPTGTCRARFRNSRLTRLRSIESNSSSPDRTTVTAQLIASATASSAPSSSASSPRKSPSITSTSSNTSSSGKSSPSPGPYSPSKSPSPSSPSPKTSWERHYGCWRSHVRSQSDQSGSPSPNSSTPASPIHYRISGANRRSDSIVSIASVSSVTSLPARLPHSEKTSPLAASRYQHGSPDRGLTGTGSGSGTRTCPSTPRRMPAIPIAKASSSTTNNARGGHGHLQLGRGRNLEPEEETLTVILHNSSSSPGVAGSSSTNSSAKVSKPYPWSSSRGRGFQVASATTTTAAAPSTHATTSSLSRSAAAGITRWVMKRSSYRYTLESSFNK